MSKGVCVLLSSYNGEKYIKEQINSIINQKHCNIHILIRDDGSKDSTCKILQEYNSDRISVIKGNNIGAVQSFLKLIENAPEFEYYAFSDQDDVWDQDKLERALELLKLYDNIPALYSSNTRLVDKNLNLIEIENDNPELTLGSAIIKNYVTGCTVVFNKKLMDKLKLYEPHNIPFHDWWVNLVVLSVGGKSIYDNVPHISYRQHEDNVVGATQAFIPKWKNRLKKYKSKPYYRDEMARQLLMIYKDDMKEEDRIILSDISNYKKNKLKVIFNKKIKTKKMLDNIAFGFCVLTNKI